MGDIEPGDIDDVDQDLPSNRYRRLETCAVVFRVLAVIVGIVGGLGAIGTFFSVVTSDSGSSDLGVSTTSSFDWLVLLESLGSLVFIAVAVLVLLAFSYLIELSLDTADNVYSMLEDEDESTE